jgi:DNA-binding response OmpR family regulator
MNILIIEESKTISQIVSRILEINKHNVTKDNGNLINSNYIKNDIYDLIIINTNLMKDRTIEILKIIREYKIRSKIIGICSHGGWKDKVNFLRNGGDDVISYPFPVQELVERINSLKRRPQTYLDDNLYIGDYILDTDSKLLRGKNIDIKLRNKEYELLEYLTRNKDRIISRCELLDHVWDYREYRGSNTVDVHIKRLRDKIDNRELIRSVHGKGYRVVDTKPKSS